MYLEADRGQILDGALLIRCGGSLLEYITNIDETSSLQSIGFSDQSLCNRPDDPYVDWLWAQQVPLFAGCGILWRLYRNTLIPASVRPLPVQVSQADTLLAREQIRRSFRWCIGVNPIQSCRPGILAGGSDPGTDSFFTLAFRGMVPAGGIEPTA